MRIYKNVNVYDEALERIRFIFDEFPNVIVNFSGGKDSTVILHLSLMVARELNRLPLKVMWIDQEAEWQATVDQATLVMNHPDVEPMWFQMPIRLFNATSTIDHWLYCWRPEDRDKWIHPQVDISIKENTFGTDRFHALFPAIKRYYFPDEKACCIAGVRTEESPARFAGLTYHAKYKWITWAKTEDKKRNHFTFYPIYDWPYIDVWKAIFDNKWPYNRLYDVMYRYGTPIMNMRVSNVHHETAVSALFYIQEVEPEVYERLTYRLAGIDMAAKMGKDDYFPRELPFMFSTWREYRDYLLDNLIIDKDRHKRFKSMFATNDRKYGELIGDMKYQYEINSILTNDWEGVKLDGLFHTGKAMGAYDEKHGRVRVYEGQNA